MTDEEILGALVDRWPDCKPQIVEPDVVEFSVCRNRGNRPASIMGVIKRHPEWTEARASLYGHTASISCGAVVDAAAIVATVVKAVDALPGIIRSAASVADNMVRRIHVAKEDAPTSTHEEAQAEAVAYFAEQWPRAKLTKIDEGCICQVSPDFGIQAKFNDSRTYHRGEWAIIIETRGHTEGVGTTYKVGGAIAAGSLSARAEGPKLGPTVDAAMAAFDGCAAGMGGLIRRLRELGVAPP